MTADAMQVEARVLIFLTRWLAVHIVPKRLRRCDAAVRECFVVRRQSAPMRVRDTGWGQAMVVQERGEPSRNHVVQVSDFYMELIDQSKGHCYRSGVCVDVLLMQSMLL